MIASVIHDDAGRFAEHLARLCPKGRSDAMMNAVLGSGGVYQSPPETGVALFEINHLGIQASGISEFAAIHSWIRKARKATTNPDSQKKAVHNDT